MEKRTLSYAGEYLVAAKLSLMGYIVSVTPKGAPGIDLLVYDPNENRACALQVKAVRAKHVQLGVKSTKGDIDKRLKEKVRNPFVIIHIPPDGGNPDFYIIPPENLRKIAKQEYLKWLTQGRHKKRIEELERTPQPLVVSLENLKPYKDKWENIWSSDKD